MKDTKRRTRRRRGSDRFQPEGGGVSTTRVPAGATLEREEEAAHPINSAASRRLTSVASLRSEGPDQTLI